MKPVRVEREAKQELAAAAAWYEERREGLGRELPLYPRVAPELGARRAFIELAEVVRVLAIAHEKRRPGYWVGRLKGS